LFTGFATSQYTAGARILPRDSAVPVADTDTILRTSCWASRSKLSAVRRDFLQLRVNAFDFFVQDDWRFRSNLSFNLGLRYEYNGPYTEANNQIANLE